MNGAALLNAKYMILMYSASAANDQAGCNGGMSLTSERRDVWSEVLSKATAVKVRNVMNPLLWLNAVAVPSCIGSAIILQNQLVLAIPLVLTGIAIPLWTLLEFDYFAKREPQRLQSEEFLIEQHRLLLQSKGSADVIDASVVVAGANPELPDLSGGRIVGELRIEPKNIEIDARGDRDE